MSTCRSASGKTSRRSILKASVVAGAGMTLITPFGWTAKAQDDGYNIAFIQGVIGDKLPSGTYRKRLPVRRARAAVRGAGGRGPT